MTAERRTWGWWASAVGGDGTADVGVKLVAELALKVGIRLLEIMILFA